MGKDVTDPKTIFVVADDAALRSSLAFILGVEGFKVRAYASGGELQDEKEFPDIGCLVVDQRLRDIDGLQLVGVMRRRGVQLPAILITTYPTAELRRRAEAANVPIVEKPLITGTLFQRIAAALK